MLDSTIVRAHPCAAGAQKHEAQALGRSRGGFSCNIHLTVDGLGNSVRARLTAGQHHDSTQAEVLIDGVAFTRVICGSRLDMPRRRIHCWIALALTIDLTHAALERGARADAGKEGAPLAEWETVERVLTWFLHTFGFVEFTSWWIAPPCAPSNITVAASLTVPTVPDDSSHFLHSNA